MSEMKIFLDRFNDCRIKVTEPKESLASFDNRLNK